jgi:hypothetical protein
MATYRGTLGDLSNDQILRPLDQTDARPMPLPDDARPMPLGPDPGMGPAPSGWQNPEASMAPGAIANAPRLYGNVLYEHGNQRTLQPNEIAAAQGYVDDFWRQFGGNQGNVWGSGHANDPYTGNIPFPAGMQPPDWVPPEGSPAATKTGPFLPGPPPDQHVFQPGPYSHMGGAVRAALRAAVPFFGGGGSGAGTIANHWQNGGGTLGDLANTSYTQQRGNDLWAGWSTPNLRNRMMGQGWTPTGSSYGQPPDPTMVR